MYNWNSFLKSRYWFCIFSIPHLKQYFLEGSATSQDSEMCNSEGGKGERSKDVNSWELLDCWTFRVLISLQWFSPFFSSNWLIIKHKEANGSQNVSSGSIESKVGMKYTAGSVCSVKNRKVKEREKLWDMETIYSNVLPIPLWGVAWAWGRTSGGGVKWVQEPSHGLSSPHAAMGTCQVGCVFYNLSGSEVESRKSPWAVLS